mmetsp:Transcript_60918/g.178077  ORF Transcript_60918/g.178077 Transcript_60918/m.178077 type:complete len:699 (+) Transcript_60918:55-2151(+)
MFPIDPAMGAAATHGAPAPADLAMDAPPAKGAGKGAPPGPPPQFPVAATGAGKGVPTKGKGKGLPPGPPLPEAIDGVAGKGKGKGKGKHKGLPPPFGPPPPPRGHPSFGGDGIATPPQELLAPPGAVPLRSHRVLRSAEGTLWEGLDLWGTRGSGVLEFAVIDVERLQRLWEEMPEPPMPREHQARHQSLPGRLLQSVEIAVRAQRLEADLVWNGLMENAEVLSPDQAEVLYTVVLPAVREAEPHLRLIVERRGALNLSKAEAVLWTLANMPLMELRMRIVQEQHHVDEEVQQVQEWVAAAQEVVDTLKESRPVRTVLQTILAIRNILGQRGHPGYTIPGTLDSLSQERLPRHSTTRLDPITGEPMPVDLAWFRENNPSVLTLAAEMLESTHENRCRLRFLRMLAVGRLIREDGPLRIIWSFLDDLHESPRDALPLLAKCSSGLCSRDLMEEMTRYAVKFRHLVSQEISILSRHPSVAPTSLFSRQLAAISLKFANALEAYENGCQALSATAMQLCSLGGQSAISTNAARFDGAASVLRSMRLLGSRLGQEMSDICDRRRQQARANVLGAGRSAGTGLRRRWAPVDTSGHTVLATSDPDIVRQMRWRPVLTDEADPAGEGQTESAGDDMPGEESESPEAVRARQEREASLRHFSNMVHGGAEGAYRRDPITGRWGRRLDGMDGTAETEIMLGGPRAGP